MSFYSDSQSQSGVPPSAQRYRSLFGGSSQVTVDEGHSLPYKEEEALSQLDGAAASGPSLQYGESHDDLDYIQTSDVELSTSPRKGFTIARSSPGSRAKSTLKTRESPEGSTSPPYRPNRLNHRPSLWLKLTRDDREIAEALRETVSRDLAAHLYNAHVMQSQGLANTDQLDEDDTNDDELTHDDLLGILDEWTAWPMPSDEVPRADERLRRLEDDRWTFRMKPDARPSAELEECITAFLSKIAKERFQSREWAALTASDSKTIPQPENDTAKSDKKEGQADTKGNETTDWEDEEEGLRRPLRPIAQIDDDESRRKLRPLARNVIAHFENLLVGLHRFHGASQSDDGRSNRSRSRGRGRARSSSLASDMSSSYSRNMRTEDDSEVQHHTDRKLDRRASSSGNQRSQRMAGRSYSRGRKRRRRASQSSQQSGTRVESAHSLGRGARSTSANSTGRTELTDWRDVAGVASMVGLPPAVLRRATERFSALVGEDVEFPTFYGDHDQAVMDDMFDWTSTKDEMDLDESPPRSALASRGTSIGKRSASPAGRVVVRANERALSSRDNSTKREHILVCPFKNCRRHEKGFSRTWNLNQHLKTMHPSYRPKDKSQTRSGAQSGYDSDRSG
ncbi:uncharacterized protein DSM5745_01215 [Aspergillus mulundensis]|uniref:C2H2-type domain-containing protein n=1 Tax=Aspergillus mulundensis TaxID=1810919 RepID=A0A3D8T5R6_9EURO|nr:Uncharacterized protein DSM5745_01215 [Aspergillus mulundensis]RDW93893.1 Uncharacterized protein DSM5745_01215 [Aspergillus mulundensis]